MAAASPPSSPLDRVAPFVLYPDFLPTDEHRALLDWTLEQETAFRVSRLVGGTVRTTIRSSQRLPVDVPGPWKASFEARARALVPTMIEALAVQPFVIDMIELNVVRHNHGDFYRRHIDTAIRNENRRTRTISAVYYFHTEPQGFAGGALRLHAFARGEGCAFTDIAPRQNQLVAFPSWAPHEVMPITCPSGRFVDSRFSINCWIHRPVPAQ